MVLHLIRKQWKCIEISPHFEFRNIYSKLEILICSFPLKSFMAVIFPYIMETAI